MKSLQPLENDHEVIWLVDDCAVNKKMTGVLYMPKYRVETRFIKYIDLLKNFYISFKILKREKPDVVISTGA